MEGLERLKNGNWRCIVKMDLFSKDNRRMITYLFKHGYFRKGSGYRPTRDFNLESEEG
jgi:hypothetical protein